mgnify:CR=1 FL=1|nr:MAG TPA_asm: holin [Caudoviricetes sp.]
MDNVMDTFRNLANDMVIKLLASSLLVALFYHAVLFGLFGCVVFLDLFTRWLALSHQHLVTHKQEATLVDCLYGIPSAHKAGLISSYVMRKTFFSKMITYLLLIIGASIVDYLIKGSGGGVMAVSLVITYLSMTELLSIVENLDEAGVSAMHDLIDLIKGRRM